MSRQTLKFTPLAWLHYQFLCHAGPTEVGAYGVHLPGDPFTVNHLWVPKQECSAAFVQCDDEAWEDFLLSERGGGFVKGRPVPIWLHTHPGSSATPSGFDEKNWREEHGKEGQCPLALFGILARYGETYGRAQSNAPYKFTAELDFEVLWDKFPDYADVIREEMAGWKAEYDAKVTEKKYQPAAGHWTLGDYDWTWRDWRPGQGYSVAALQNGEVKKEAEAAAVQQGGVVIGDGYGTRCFDDAAEAVAVTTTEPAYPPGFEAWLEQVYETTPGRLDRDNLESAIEEFEYYGVDEPLCPLCGCPLDEDEEQDGECTDCIKNQWRDWHASQAQLDDIIDAAEARHVD